MLQSLTRLKTNLPSFRSKLWGALPPVFLFFLNLWICGRLLHIEYLDQRGSIEGSFIALAAYIRHHWPLYDWFPLWYTGLPFLRVYQPGLHYAVALFAAASGLSVPSAYHVVVAIAYSLGGATFYLLALALTRSRLTAFLSALVFSLFSPSVLLSSAVRGDVGGYLNARRLHALIHYGESPNVTGLTFVMLALAALHFAMKRRTALTGFLAALAIAAVPAISWPATMALIMGIVAYIAALEPELLKPSLIRLAIIGAAAWALASPFAPPSTILSTLHGTGMMAEAPTPGSPRWTSLGLLAATFLLARAVLLKTRAAEGLRFSLLFALITGWVALEGLWFQIRVVPYPARFHLAMEIPLVLTGTFIVASLLARWPQVRIPFTAVFLLFCAFQAYHFRNYVRQLTHSLDIAQTLEYQEGRWFDANIHGGRVLASGSVSFWMNDFTETPQMTGAFDQALSNPEVGGATYLIYSGYLDDRQSADYSQLWLKAFGVDAFASVGKQSREYYKALGFPDRFKGRLPVLWQNGDDVIYQIPERAPGLARVVPVASLVRNHPYNGIDVGQLRVFVGALDNPALPLATTEWQGLNSAKIDGTLAPNQAVEVPISYDRGWTASANGKPVPVIADGLGFLAFQPHCDGPCAIQLKWNPGSEPFMAWSAAIITLIGAAVLVFRERRQGS